MPKPGKVTCYHIRLTNCNANSLHVELGRLEMYIKFRVHLNPVVLAWDLQLVCVLAVHNILKKPRLGFDANGINLR